MSAGEGVTQGGARAAVLQRYAARFTLRGSPNLAAIFELLVHDEEELALLDRLPGVVEALAAETGWSAARVRRVADRLLARGVIETALHDSGYLQKFSELIELRDATALWPAAPDALYERWERLLCDEIPALLPLLEGLRLPAPMRVVPHEGAVANPADVLDVDSARRLFARARLVTAVPCPCRTQARRVGHRHACPAPQAWLCLQTDRISARLLRRGVAERLTNTEALRRIGDAADAGLVHTLGNHECQDTMLCNCCTCCCAGLSRWRRPGGFPSFAAARFVATVDRAACTGCGACVAGCPFGAIGHGPVVDEGACFGCGLCAARCPGGALQLRPRGAAAKGRGRRGCCCPKASSEGSRFLH